jgi:hypothetical protein
MYSRCYAIGEYGTTVSEQRLDIYVPAETNKHVNNTRPIAGHPPMTTTEEQYFPCGSAEELSSQSSSAR